MKNFIITEDDSNIAIAVVKDVVTNAISFQTDIAVRVGLAVKEHFCYEKVTLIGEIVQPNKHDDGYFSMEFDCVTQEGGNEIRDIEISEIAIY